MTSPSATLLLAVVLGLSSAASPAPDSAFRASIDASRPADLHATVQQEGAKVVVGGAGVGGEFVVFIPDLLIMVDYYVAHLNRVVGSVVGYVGAQVCNFSPSGW